MEVMQTVRGFDIIEFMDDKGYLCSLQKSSDAEKDCIWFGVTDPDLKFMVPRKGWVDYPLSDCVEIFGRMHLTQDHVKALLPYLQNFVETGEIKTTPEHRSE